MRLHWFPFVLLCGCADGTAGSLPTTQLGGGTFELGVPLFIPGLRSAVPGPGQIRVELELPEDGFEGALFVSTDRASLFSGVARAELEDEVEVTLDGLSGDTLYFLGMGLRREGESDYEPVGVTLSARTGAPIYVDASADPTLADGLSPQTAYPDPVLALIDALVRGGANLWVRGGDYEISNLPVFAGVHLYGGFSQDFDLETRDPDQHGTRWITALGGSGISLQGPGAAIVVDGLSLLGAGLGSIGVDIVDVDTELRRVEVQGFADRGVRVRTGSDTRDLVMLHCNVGDNGADGLSLSGPMDVSFDRCSFVRNGQEGVDLGPLIAPSGETARLLARGSLFAGNQSEGLDADLSAPSVLANPPGRFVVVVEGSRFEANGLDGLLVDVDFETAPGWSADVTLRDSGARANGASGYHVDADAATDLFIQRVVASANLEDGLLITSESQAGLAVVGTSVFSANRGAGVRADLGNFAPLLSHCVLAGNASGGLLSLRVPGSASSCVFWMQPNPLQGAGSAASPVLSDPMSPPFVNAGEAFLSVSAISAATLTVPGAAAIAPNAILELADDGNERRIQALVPGGIVLTEEALGVGLPASLVAFPFDAGVVEDYGVRPGSGAAGAGLVPPGAAARHAGPEGSPAAGTEDGVLASFGQPLRPVDTLPALATGLSDQQDIEIHFSADLDPASLAGEQVRVLDPGGRSIPAGVFVQGKILRIMPPSGGWGGEDVSIELHAGLASLAGEGLATPGSVVFHAR